MDLDRRDFLKVIGLGTAGSMLPGCEGSVARLVPYVLPDEEIVPGVANWYATVCGECGAGCGIVVRTMEGRAKKIEGNPDHPLNQGKSCAVGQASLQGLYNPDRLRGPLRREGKRGEGRFKPISWEEGIARWVDALKKHPGGGALLSRPVSGTLGVLFSRFMEATSGRLLFYDPSAEIPLRTANRLSFGVDYLPHYDLANTTYLLSFGAPYLGHWLSPVYFGIAYGKMRQGRPRLRGYFVQVEPRLSMTGANADRWVPVRPGAEGWLALGIGHVLLKEGRARLPKNDQKKFEAFYNRYSLEEIATRTGVPHEEIVRLAREFSNAGAPLAIGGGMGSEQTNGTDVLMAINALNLLVGNIGQTGGIRFIPPAEGFPSPSFEPAGEAALAALKDEFKEGRRAVLMLHQTNPLYTLPPAMKFDEAFEAAALVVSFNSFLDESTAMADLILPDHHPLEGWGDHVQEGLIARPAVGLRQPVVIPKYDTRRVGDTFLQAARQHGGKPASRLPWADFLEMVRAQWKDFLEKKAPAQPFETAWVEALQRGGWWGAEGEPVAPPRRNLPAAFEPPRFAGDEKEYPFYFYPFTSIGLHDGRGANKPWLQELPDPTTTIVWGSWVEINPTTARRMKIRPGEIVRVVSPFGMIEAPAVFYAGSPPDLIAVPQGQGHDFYGRYAQGRGVNPRTILAPWVDARSGGLALGATRVRIEPTGNFGRPVFIDTTSQGLRQNPGALAEIEQPI